jgi:hypothetical protein
MADRVNGEKLVAITGLGWAEEAEDRKQGLVLVMSSSESLAFVFEMPGRRS